LHKKPNILFVNFFLFYLLKISFSQSKAIRNWSQKG
jgi:hypothetical protein